MPTGWIGSDRRKRLPPNWEKEIRPRILARDGYACTHIRQDTMRRCNDRANQVDHVVPGDDHSDSNLTSLCAYHHLKKSSSEGGRASSAARARRRKATPRRHPGLLP
jgi:5-methylcytosine-specific restriction protein A